MTAFTLTKRDNQSPGMARSADSAIDPMIHGQVTRKATTVPEAGRALARRVTDRKSGGEILRHFMRPAQALDERSQNATADGNTAVTWQVICPVDGNIYPCRGCCRNVWLPPGTRGGRF